MTAPARPAARRDWLLATGGLVVASALFFGRDRGAATGTPLPFALTVVPADAQGLDCASRTPIGGQRCAFDGRGQRVEPAGAAERPLRPFVTTGGELLLLGGVFEESHVADWLREANAQGSAARVTLECQGEFLSLSGAVRIRFAAENPWQPERDLSVGRIETCAVVGR
jgi:hypothetical protein